MSAVKSGQTAVSSTATQILALGTTFVYAVTNTSEAETVYLGDSGVTTSNGFPLPPGKSLPLADYAPNTGSLYGVTAGASVTVGWLGVG